MEIVPKYSSKETGFRRYETWIEIIALQLCDLEEGA